MAAIRKDAKPKPDVSGQLDAVLREISAGEAVHRALTHNKLQPGKFYEILASDEAVATRYARAKTLGLDRLADEALQIADDVPPMVQTKDGEHTDAGHVAWAKNRIETRKWLLSKLAPKKWGEKLETTLQGPEGGPVQVVTTDWNSLRAAMKKAP